MADKENIYKLFDFLRLPLILGVVLIHSNFLDDIDTSNLNIGCFSAFITAFSYLLSSVVPTFFFISGYLFFRNGLLTPNSFHTKIRRRWHSLIIPYLIWNTIALCLVLIKLSPYFEQYFPQYDYLSHSFIDWIIGYFSLPHSGTPFDMPLWFLRNLIVIIFFTPLISIGFRYLKFWFPFVTLLLVIPIASTCFLIPPSTLFFIFGASFPLLNISLHKVLKPHIFWIVFFISVSILDYTSHTALTALIFRLFGIMAILSLGDIIIDNLHSKAGHDFKCVFFIYAFHGLFCTALRKIIVTCIPPENDILAFADYLLIFLLLSVISITVYKILNCITPRFVTLVSGGR